MSPNPDPALDRRRLRAIHEWRTEFGLSGAAAAVLIAIYADQGLPEEQAKAWYRIDIDASSARHWTKHAWQPEQVQRLVARLGRRPSRTPGDPACPAWAWCRVATAADHEQGSLGAEIALLMLAAGLTPSEALRAAVAISSDATGMDGLRTMAALKRL